ncbi:MAG: hypothetical protein M0006_11345 [Magnetospirillum sp.]|nr:hypothetical protein [Magnetospirillum sp.]
MMGSVDAAQADPVTPWWLSPAASAGGAAPLSLSGNDVFLAQAAGANGQQAAPPPGTPALPEPSNPTAPIAPNVMGVLTRKGVLVIDPSLEYQHTSVNTFVAGGVALLNVFMIGNFNASQQTSDAVTATLGFRYGITDRLEGELRVPYMYRNSTSVDTLVSTTNFQQTTGMEAYALGDIEWALHYQVNDGQQGWPVFVANFRTKSNTGTGPFDNVRFDPAGNEISLPTGSGFWAVEPSVTMIIPSDPAVFYVNTGYLYSIPGTVDRTFDPTHFITTVNPGGAVRFGMGMGVALNEKVSFLLGYQEDFISGTLINFGNGSSFTTSSLSVGVLNVGMNWQTSKTSTFNINLGVGVTRDAPDVDLLVRMPFSLDLN